MMPVFVCSVVVFVSVDIPLLWRRVCVVIILVGNDSVEAILVLILRVNDVVEAIVLVFSALRMILRVLVVVRRAAAVIAVVLGLLLVFDLVLLVIGVVLVDQSVSVSPSFTWFASSSTTTTRTTSCPARDAARCIPGRISTDHRPENATAA